MSGVSINNIVGETACKDYSSPTLNEFILLFFLIYPLPPWMPRVEAANTAIYSKVKFCVFWGASIRKALVFLKMTMFIV
jgi:hypothetical protein